MSGTNPVLIPNTFQVPNVFVDKLFLSLESSDVKILLFVCRKTYGWQKIKDRISLTQFMKGTALSRRCLIYRLKLLTDSGLLCREQTKIGDIYWLNLAADLDVVQSILIKDKKKNRPVEDAEDREESATDAPSAIIAPVQPMHQESATDAPLTSATDAPTETHILKPTVLNPNTIATEVAEISKNRFLEVVTKAFEYYCKVFKRRPTQYTLTDTRRDKALLRLKERTAIVGFDEARREFKIAIDNLHQNEHCVTNGYIDWIAQIFKSTEEFEKRVNWQPPTSRSQKSDEQNKRIDSGNSVLGDWAARAAAGAKDPATSELPPGSRPLLGTSG